MPPYAHGYQSPVNLIDSTGNIPTLPVMQAVCTRPSLSVFVV